MCADFNIHDTGGGNPHAHILLTMRPMDERGKEQGFYIGLPKSDSGIRQIPMSQNVYEAFKRVLKRPKPGTPHVVGGYGGFLFTQSNGSPKRRTDYGGMCIRLLKKHNKAHDEKLSDLSPSSAAPYILHENGKRRHEPQSVAVHHGSRQHNHDAEPLCSRHI